jgi:hypothetical protein
MTKINVTTHLDDIFTTALRPTLRDDQPWWAPARTGALAGSRRRARRAA